MEDSMIFTLDELRQYDGIHNEKIYFAYNGFVYDATGSFLWKG
jgi:predicted heme/steroid binding protein